MIGQLQNPSQGFEDVVKAHFYLKKDRILQVDFLSAGGMYCPRQSWRIMWLLEPQLL